MGDFTIFKLADPRHLEFWESNNGFSEKPMWDLSSIETTALNCLIFEKIVFLCTRFGDRQKDEQTEPLRKGALAVASGA